MMGATTHPHKAGDVVLPEADGVEMVLSPFFFLSCGFGALLLP